MEAKNTIQLYSKWGDYLLNVFTIIDAYEPDIVVIEAAERVDRTPAIEALF